MCPEVIFTLGAVQVNYYKDTACEVHKKLSPFFSYRLGGETPFVAALEHSHDEKMINMLQTNNISLLFPKLCQSGRSVPVWSGVPRDGDGTPGGGRGSKGCRDGPPSAPPSCLGFARCICKWFHDQSLQLGANICQYINVVLAMLHTLPTNREKPKPHGFWFMPTTGWTCWQISEAAPPRSVEMDKSLR